MFKSIIYLYIFIEKKQLIMKKKKKIIIKYGDFGFF